MCFLCSCLAAARVCLATKIRLKCLHSGKASLFTAEISSRNITHTLTSAGRQHKSIRQQWTSRWVWVCVRERERVFYEQDLNAHIIYYHESRVSHRVISKPDCLCLQLFRAAHFPILLFSEFGNSSKGWFYANKMIRRSSKKIFSSLNGFS